MEVSERVRESLQGRLVGCPRANGSQQGRLVRFSRASNESHQERLVGVPGSEEHIKIV
jgi:hypothetical protein